MLQAVGDLMPIGEFSERSGLSPKRLRSYAADGLLVPAAVDSASGYRYYAAGQLREAKLIDALRRAEMPLADIASLLRHRSLDELDGWARQVDLDASQRHEALRVARRLLASESEPASAAERKDAMATFQATARTDIGRVRENNEDAVLCLDHVVAVADGMGGLPGGEIASSLAIALLRATFTGSSLDELEAAVRAANWAICDHAARGSGLEGMGTTLCAVGTTADGRVAVVNVGDSRAYLMRDGSLRQLTEDHSVTAEMVRRGELTEDEAAGHPHHAILTRVLGAGPTVEVDGALHTVVEGDRLLLCTDGLLNEVPADDIQSVMTEAKDMRAAVDELVERALSSGGRDNVTVVVAEVSVGS